MDLLRTIFVQSVKCKLVIVGVSIIAVGIVITERGSPDQVGFVGSCGAMGV